MACSPHGRARPVAAFATPAGVNPLQASSANTVPHSLNRHWDYQVNKVLDAVARSRMALDPDATARIKRRTQKPRRDAKSSTASYWALALTSRLGADTSRCDPDCP